MLLAGSKISLSPLLPVSIEMGRSQVDSPLSLRVYTTKCCSTSAIQHSDQAETNYVILLVKR
uniref:Uncharacterized protein n=1 Tax=Utricularia reniformis TaxID=192314 RepID=A0A1Y0B4L2_9LAMI|nr:hypothetical protein AEK19_MT2177 [Utricularia reniformis]ART32324.1 hypothetical protein AEK19_MT2177 [Utricularia reniformis]